MEKIFEQLDFTYESELFEKRNNINEDCVHFEVYCEEEEKGEEVFVDLLAQVEAYFADYIWNFSPLQLRRKNDHVEGVLQFGDLYDEAWLLVAFLLDYSEKRKNVKCRIIDADGEFLLIEGADHVPAWLEPGNDTKRVWIQLGHVYLVPQSVAKLENVKLRESYKAGKSLENCVVSRARARSKGSLLHSSRVLLNSKAASILKSKPQLIAPVIQAFYTRDPGDMKHLTLMKHFPRANLVNCSVTFNKCHFAQLLSLKFAAHRKSGYVPAPLSDEPDYLAFSLGAKLAAGLEILVNEGENGPTGLVDDEKVFGDFVDKLTKRDFFGGNIIGSARHNELMDRARQFYRDTHDNEETNESYRRQSARVVGQVYHRNGENVKFDSNSPIIDESLEWLDLDENEFVTGLSDKYEWKSGEKDKTNQMADQMKRFVSQKSDLLDGVDNEDLTEGLRLDPAKFGACIDRLIGRNKDSDDEESDYLDSDDLDSDTEQYYEAMKAELDGEKVMTGLVKSEDVVEGVKDESLSVDLNLVSGLLKSFESQMGLSGPAGNVMKSIGLDLPQ